MEFLALENIRTVSQIIAGLIVIISFFLLALPARNHFKLDAVVKYFQQADTEEMRKARDNVLESKLQVSKQDAKAVCDFYHFWGLMVKKHTLPIWVFESSSGIAVFNLYRKLEHHINHERKNNPQYGEYFEWLSKKINRKYGVSRKLQKET